MGLFRTAHRVLSPLWQPRTHSDRRVRLESALRLLHRGLRQGSPPPPGLVNVLRRNWGNAIWRADGGFLLAMIEWMQRTRGSVLECGSGLSTLMLAAAGSAQARSVHALEHNPAWLGHVRSSLPDRLRQTVHLHHAPVCSYPGFNWYDVGDLQPTESFGFIVCDGPPGSTPGGRYGLVPLLRDRFAPGAIIILDDAQRRAERRIVDRWCAELPASVIHRTRTHAVLQARG